MRTRSVMAGAWLLERAGVDRALAGDLVEAATRGASMVWYGRQALMAVLRAWFSEVRDHKWLALRAVATGWVTWAVLTLLIRLVGDSLDPAAMFWLKLARWTVIGWAIGRLHRPYPCAMVSVFAAFSVVMLAPAVHQVMNSLGHPMYTPPASAGTLAAVIGSLLAGGLLSAQTVENASKTGQERR